MGLENCGRYTKSLTEIADEIKKNKILRGEKITSIDELNINEDIYMAYQKILSIAKTKDSIAEAIDGLKTAILISGNTNNIEQIAVTVAKDAIKDKKNTKVKDEKAVAIGTKLEDKSKSSKEQKPLVERLRNPKIEKGYKILRENAKENAKDATVIHLINMAIKYMAVSKDNHAKGKKAGALVIIKRLLDTKDETAAGIAEQMANVFELNVYSEDKTGKKVIDLEKIEEMRNGEINRVCGKDYDIERVDGLNRSLESDYENVERRSVLLGRTNESYEGNIRSAERAIEIGKFVNKYDNAYLNHNMDEINELIANTDINLIKEALNSRLKVYNNLQAKNSTKYNSDSIERYYYLGECISEKSKAMQEAEKNMGYNIDENTIPKKENKRLSLEDDGAR